MFFRVFLVEPRGIEPLSENPSTQFSPSADCLLKFPHADADRQASALGSYGAVKASTGILMHDKRVVRAKSL